jgi:hypothetical protein
VNRKQKILTVVAVIAFVLNGIAMIDALNWLAIFPDSNPYNVRIGFVRWFMLGVVYTALFFVLRGVKK